MKAFTLFLLALSLSLSAAAQKAIDNGTKYGAGEDSIRCVTNINLFVPYAKQGDYKSAAEFWEIVFNECPGSTIFLYRYGPQIINYQYQMESDPTKRAALFDKLMTVYDKRIQYFGEDPKYPAAWIEGMKALDYLNYKNQPSDLELPLKWLKSSIKGMGERAEVAVLYKYFELVTQLYKADPVTRGQSYIDDYLLVSETFDACISAAPKNLDAYTQTKEGIDVLFATSGAADCATMEKVFGSKIEENKQNAEFLKTINFLFARINCNETEAYYTASAYLHKLTPTASSADGCAAQAYKKKEFDKAFNYWEEAIKLETENIKKADYYYKMAAVSFADMNNSPRARQYALKAIENNPNNGSYYILIAVMYARSSISDDPVINRTRFWAAVDKLQKAKQLDPSCAEEANKLIGSYAASFPNKEDVFMHPDLNSGKSYVVGGWIGESTICR